VLLESAVSRVPEVDKVDTDKAKAVSILASHKRRCDVLGLSLNASKSVAKKVLVVMWKKRLSQQVEDETCKEFKPSS
jgi:hypothetical protein